MPNKRRRAKTRTEAVSKPVSGLASTPRNQAPVPQEEVTTARRRPRWRHWLRSPGVWALGLGFPVFVAVAVPVATELGADVFDVPEVRDSVRAQVKDREDFRYTVRYEDPGFELILPTERELTGEQASQLHDFRDGSFQDLMAGLRRAGAATPVKQMNIVVTAIGQRHQSLQVDAIRPVEIRRTAPYTGTFLFVPPQDGGRTHQMMFDFDSPSPQALTVVGEEEPRPGRPYFQRHTLTIKDGAEDRINIATISTRHAVTFKIRVDYRIGEEPRNKIIDDGGRPFAITPINCLDRTRLTKDGIQHDENGDPILGHASYDHIWTWVWDKNGRGSLVKAKNPRRYRIGYPYC